MKIIFLIAILFFTFKQDGDFPLLEAPSLKEEYVETSLKDRLPPIEFVFINCAQSQQTFDDPLTTTGIQQAIQAARLLKSYRRPYMICGHAIALRETTKFLAEEMGILQRQRLSQQGGTPPLGHYTEIGTSSVLDTTDTDTDLDDQLMDLIKEGFSHESTLFLISNKHVFNMLQRELTDEELDLKYGDVCVFIPISNKKWKIDYRPNTPTETAS